MSMWSNDTAAKERAALKVRAGATLPEWQSPEEADTILAAILDGHLLDPDTATYMVGTEAGTAVALGDGEATWFDVGGFLVRRLTDADHRRGQWTVHRAEDVARWETLHPAGGE